MKWVLSSEDSSMPEWLRTNLNEVCQYCGSSIENGYNDAGECTRRRCSNKKCPKMMGEKIGRMCEILNVPNIRGGNGVRLVNDYRLQSHFEAIPIIYNQSKPRVVLSTFLRCACIYGIDSEFDSIAGTFSTVSEMFNNYRGKYLSVLEECKDELLSGEQYFDIVQPEQVEKKYPTVIYGDIVITGVLPGVSDRDKFVGIVNKMYKGLTAFGYSKSKRKTGLYCCIAQDKNTTSGKANDARDNGFPVLTVDEFFKKLNSDISRAGYDWCLEEIAKERRTQ